jgi:hypothetical protein
MILHVPDPFVLSRMSNMWHAFVQDLLSVVLPRDV